MSTNTSFLNQALAELVLILEPLRVMKDQAAVLGTLERLGYAVPEGLFSNVDFGNLFAALEDTLDLLYDLDEHLEQDGELKVFSELLKNTALITADIIFFRDRLEQELRNIDRFLEATNFPETFPLRLFDFLLITYLTREYPRTEAILSLVGLTERSAQDAKPSQLQPDFVLHQIHWKRIPQLFKPRKLMQAVYQWDEDFQSKLFLQRLEQVMLAFSLAGGMYRQDPEVAQHIFAVPETEAYELRFPVFQAGAWGDAYGEVGLKIGEARANGKKGLGVIPYLFGVAQEDIQISDQWQIVISGGAGLDVGLGLMVTPPLEFRMIDQLFTDPNPDMVDLEFRVGLENKKRSGAEYTYLIGSAGASNLGVRSLVLSLYATKKGSQVDFGATLDLQQARIQIHPGEGDGFIQKVMGEPIELSFDMLVEITRDGVHFQGGAGLEFEIPVHKTIGPLSIYNLYLGLMANLDGLTLTAAGGFGLTLGPVHAKVDQIGLRGDLVFDEPGNLGNHNVKFGFKPPTSIGISIDSEVLTGGGFLLFDYDNERYAGILSLALSEIEITAICLITTRLPNNKPGFSMLVSISVIFVPGIQLSMGFSLNGIGGLLGINRSMKVDAIKERLASGSVNSIMFPTDPIENADRIISDLRAIFPPEEGHYVIAPFIRIGYGDSIIEIDIGVLIEIPFKGRIILLGSVGVYLPYKLEPVVELHIDIVGDLNFAGKYIQIEGRLRDSRISTVPLSGGFAFILDWGERSAFLFSIGGYHPRYRKPARFPEVPRLTALFKKGNQLSLFCECYQAITSNTFQIGFGARLKVNYEGAKVNGYFSFDALLQFKPFYFRVDISLNVDVRYEGHSLAAIDMYFFLEGPSPWVARGTAKIKVLFIDFKVKFKYEWGQKKVEAASITPLETLLEEVRLALQAPHNWATHLPANYQTAEYLRPAEEVSADGLVMHPAGYLEVTQSVVPLNQRVEKRGNAQVKGRPVFSISDEIYLGAEEGALLDPSSYAPISANFARAQFERMKDAEKISTPDFEPMVAGLSFGAGDAGGFDLGDAADYTDTSDIQEEPFENIIIKADGSVEKEAKATALMKHEVNTLSQKRMLRKSGRRSKWTVEQANKYEMIESTLPATAPKTYVIAGVEGMEAVPGGELGRPNEFPTYSEAKAHLNTWQGDRRAQFQIVYTQALETA